MELSNAKKVLLLCDGMGSGSVAGRESAGVTELAESLCEAGYPPSLLIRVINSALMIQEAADLHTAPFVCQEPLQCARRQVSLKYILHFWH